MVRICDTLYPDGENKYSSIFNSYPYELDHFQKYAIQGIEDGAHVLITSHTGSGKTLPAEYAIKKFCGQGKKVIYTGPIKSLSNQKFHEFKKKFPDISFGILTGDIKFNPEADCIIMTTEILRNTLFRQGKSPQNETESSSSNIQFTIDLNELACVVFDEVHYINDADRGKVWEESIIQMPKHIQMVMLSATIDRAETFAKWIETTKEREVWLSSTNKRVVPLTHYNYMSFPSSMYKKVKDKDMELLMGRYHNTCVPIKDPSFGFYTTHIEDIHKIKQYMYKNNLYVKPHYLFNKVISDLKHSEKLPAITFVFSRRKVEEYARMIEFSLFDEESESHKSSIVGKQCEEILRKIPNYKEYIHLPEYVELVALLEKGVAIHHSGMMPILREMVEIMFDKGFVKLLVATETFAVGINMPTKTVIFTSLTKYSNGGFRELLPHEYTQMAGRAGRRGLDKVGNVIHLNNIFETPYTMNYKTMMGGVPQRLTSKFKVNYSIVLRLLTKYNTVEEQLEFMERSILQKEITEEMSTMGDNHQSLEETIELNEKQIYMYKTPLEDIELYEELLYKCEKAKQKQKKKITRQLDQLRESSRSFISDYDKYKKYKERKYELSQIKEYIESTKLYMRDTINNVLYDLYNMNFITKETSETVVYTLTEKGKYASMIQELHPLIFGDALSSGCFDSSSPEEIFSTLGSFIDVQVKDEYKLNMNCASNKVVLNNVNYLRTLREKYYSNELRTYQTIDESEYPLNYDFNDVLYQWCIVKDETSCKYILQELKNKEVLLGSFVKAVLKLNNITYELINVAEEMNNVELLYKLSLVADMTLKFVVTNQSLYV